MKFRWQLVAALSILPFGAALAEYADLTRPAPPAPPPERTAEHQSLVEVAEHGLTHATQSAHELAVAAESARRAGDMLLLTCLNDALETVRAVQTDAIANVGRMHAAKNVVEAREVSASLAEASKELHEAMENAARCATSEETSDGRAVVTVEMDSDGVFDPGSNGPGIGFPDINAPPPVTTPPIIDVMEPGTDIPPVPPAASPTR
jgi:hypothetical protein